MKSAFNSLIKSETVSMLAQTPGGIKASAIAERILFAHPEASQNWAHEKILEHITSVVEHLLRTTTDFPTPQNQLQFAAESFQACFEANPSLPVVLGILDSDGRMLYKAAVECSDNDLLRVVQYTEGQLEGLRDKVQAVGLFRDYRNELGIPSESSLSEFLQRQPEPVAQI